MEADSLNNYPVPPQTIQFSTYNDENGGAAPQDVAAAAAGYVPADSINANGTATNQGYAMNTQNANSTVQTRRQSNNMRTTTTSPSAAMRSPQQPRSSVQTRASHSTASTPSHTGSVATSITAPHVQQPATSQQGDGVQAQQDASQSQKQGSSYVFRNSTSAFPNGTPNLTRSQSKQSQVYTTPQGLVHSDPWASHHPSATGIATPNGTPNGNNDTEVDPAVAANPFSDTFPLIPDPPDLDAWRRKLFNVTETLVLSEEEFLTYFPHVDNVYSHRSTQKYKRKAFVSHYWDCRLKGRPSGTPKSDDPNKKKRKRQARERDLCNVKIKVTEYFGAEESRKLGLNLNGNETNAMNNTGLAANDTSVLGPDNSELTIVLEDGVNGNGLGAPMSTITNPIDPNFGLLELPRQLPQGHPGADGKRWFTIQRVRGNPGGGAVKDSKRDSIAAGANVMAGDGGEEEDESMVDPNLDLDHKHTLEESDRIKKNTVQRWLMKEEKEKKRLSVSTSIP